MSKVAGIDPNRPEGSRDPKLGDDDIRKLAGAVIEILDVDHYVGSDSGAGSGYEDDDAGKHSLVTFREAQGSKPTLGASDVGAAYVKQVSANGELHFEDEAGSEVRITKAKISGESHIDLDQGRLDNNGWLKAINAAGDGSVNICKVNTGDGIEFADGSLLAAATEAADPDRTIADKGYVDNKWTPTTYAAEESVTLGNGLIIKFGTQATVSTSGTTTPFGTAFPTACVTVIICDAASGGKGDTVNGSNVKSFDADGFTADAGDAGITKVNWIAIGY